MSRGAACEACYRRPRSFAVGRGLDRYAIYWAILVVGLLGDPGDTDDDLVLARVKHLDAAGTARAERDALHWHADRLAFGRGQHDLVLKRYREGCDQRTAAHRLVHRGHAHAAAPAHGVIVRRTKLAHSPVS